MSRIAAPVETLHEDLTTAVKIRSVIAPLTADLLRLGVPVVFDFGGNTVRDREWVRSVFERARANHILHYLRTDHEDVQNRVRRRNELKPEGCSSDSSPTLSSTRSTSSSCRRPPMRASL